MEKLVRVLLLGSGPVGFSIATAFAESPAPILTLPPGQSVR